MKEYYVSYIEDFPIPIASHGRYHRMNIKYRKASPQEVQKFLEEKISLLEKEINSIKEYLGEDMVKAIEETESICKIDDIELFYKKLKDNS